MATPLKEMEVGSVVTLREQGLPVPFYVAKHNYEAELNGEGRTLLVRKEGHSLHTWNDTDFNIYAVSGVDAWLNTDYLGTLDPWLKKHIGKTKFMDTTGNNINKTAPLERSVFLLSLTEFGLTNASANEAGTALPRASDLLIATYKGGVVHQWTRSPVQSAAANAFYVSNAGASANAACTSASVYARPVFTVPGDKLYVLEDGTLEANMAVISAVEEDMGEQKGEFAVSYTVTMPRGTDATVTETLYGKQLRSFTAVSGEEQSASVNTAMVPDGVHDLIITAESDGGDITEASVRFTVKPHARNSGTVQELQDEQENAVFPVTMARAVLTEGGKSVQEVFDTPVSPYEVGDIRRSVKAGLGEEWLLCNGELALKRDYPALNDLLLQSAEINAEVYRDNAFAYETLSNNYSVYGCEGGKPFIMHNDYSSTALTHVTILENGVWTTHKLEGLDAPPITNSSAIDHIHYSSGKYFFLQRVSAVSTEAGRTIYVSEDLIHWEKKVLNISGSVMTGVMWCMAMAPGGQVFVVTSYVADSKQYLCAGYGESLDGTINLTKTVTATSAVKTNARCWYAGGKFFTNRPTSTTANYIIVCDAETGEFAADAANGGKTENENVLASNAIYYEGKYFIALGSTLCWSEDAVTWHPVVVDLTNGVAYFTEIAGTMLGGKPTVVVCNYTTSATYNKISLVDMETMTKKTNKSVFAVMDGICRIDNGENGLRLIGYEIKSRKVGSATVYTKTFTVREYDTLHGFRLPTVAEDSAYVYIKAKEENA